jgi:hypothetical protein
MSTQALISEAYSAFNKRDVDGTLALMSENVNWPRASEGGRVVGKQEIREYWTRQWADFDPHLEVLKVIDRDNGKTEVQVHQLVKDRKGGILSDTVLWHVYTIQNSLIERMDILEADGNSEGQSAAFAGQGHSQ